MPRTPEARQRPTCELGSRERVAAVAIDRAGRERDGGGPAGDVFFFNDAATTEIYSLSLHDALPIFLIAAGGTGGERRGVGDRGDVDVERLGGGGRGGGVAAIGRGRRDAHV